MSVVGARGAAASLPPRAVSSVSFPAGFFAPPAPSLALAAAVAFAAAPASPLGVSYRSNRSSIEPCARLMDLMALPFSGAIAYSAASAAAATRRQHRDDC